jgi:hypothetical protein
MGSDGGSYPHPLLHARSQRQIQFEVFAQDALGQGEGGGVVFEIAPFALNM